jgi:hypothetical protein
MQFVENVTVVGRSMGENNVVIVRDENSGEEFSLINPKGMEIELGMEGNITVITEGSKKMLESFEPVMEEELV